MNKLHAQKAIHVCKAGGIIAYPTEAVFGLGCIPLYEQSVRRILRLKRRTVRKGLILVASEASQLEEFVDFSKIKNLKTVKSLCTDLGPIVSTSANPSNAYPAKSSQRVRSYFPREIDYVIPAKITNNKNPSEIRDAKTGEILRSS